MQIVNNRALVFHTDNAAQITALIPKSKVLDTEGNLDRVVVDWSLDAWRILRNLGIKDAPHPIYGKYKWPGVYVPFDHQRHTAAFLASNQRCYCLNEAGCVDSDTEYLTPTGWRRISDYQGGLVAQFVPETGYLEFVEPLEYIKKPCDLMVRIQTSKGIDQLLSPEHRVLVYDNAMRGKRVVMSAADLLVKHDNYHAGIPAPKGPTVGTPTVSFSHSAIKPHFLAPSGDGIPLTDEQLRVQIAVIADGHFGSKTNHCVVRLKRERKVTRMRHLLELAGIEFRERRQDTPTAQGFTVFTFDAPLRTKEFGSEFWAASVEQLAIVRDEVMNWDGCDRMGAKGFEFSSTSKASADFVQYAFAGGEYVARITEDWREDKYSSGVCYSVYVRRKAGTGLLSIQSKNPAGTMRLAPSTDGFKYCFSVPSTFLVLRRNGCIFTTGNTGKTSAAAWAADYLLSTKQINRVLIVCPLSIMDTAWRSDLFKTVMHRSVGIATGTRRQRLEVITSGCEFVIINFDGVKVVTDALASGGFDLVIIDEATAIKSAGTDRWKALNSIIRPSTWVWSMTGTPAAQSPEDAYGIARLTREDSVPKFAGAWRDRVMLKVTQFKWVPRHNAQQIVYDTLQPAIRYTKEECLDLPDILYTTREVPLTAQQTKYYNHIKQEMVALAAGEEITAANAASMLNKLLQLSCGAVYTDTREVIQFDIKPRLTELLGIIDNTEHKVLVFVPFRHVTDMLHEALTAHYGDPNMVEVIQGGVSAGARAETIKRFQTEDNPRILLLSPQATAHGITLTRADQIVWWGPIASTEYYLQANARAHRAGQTNKVTVTHLQGSPVEKRMYSMLQGKVDLHQSLVDLYKQEIA